MSDQVSEWKAGPHADMVHAVTLWITQGLFFRKTRLFHVSSINNAVAM